MMRNIIKYLQEDKPVKFFVFPAMGLIILFLISSFWLGISQSFKIVFGSFCVLFLPGFMITLAFMNKKDIDVLERVAMSFVLSISIVPILIFLLNLIGMRINAFNVFLVILFICFMSAILIMRRSK